jgi:hypothetical protein
MRRVTVYLDTAHHLGPFGFELRSVALVRLLLAVFQARALVVFEQTVLAAKVAVAEAAVSDDALGGFPALLGVAANSLGSHDDRFVLWCLRRRGEQVVICLVVVVEDLGET